MTDDLQTRQALADGWAMLATAFAPPLDARVREATLALLADELAQAMLDAGLEPGEDTGALKAALAALGTPDRLLREYARVFMPPGALATPNLTRYVDGGPTGPCMDALENAYARNGIQPSDGLRDLPDHLTHQCAALAHILTHDGLEAGAGFAQLCLAGALPALRDHLRQVAPDSPYTHLTALAARLVLPWTAAQPVNGRQRRGSGRRHDPSLGVWRHCPGCGKAFAREKELAIMGEALTRAGLPSAHLDRCPDCRDRDQGFFRREIA